MLALFEQQVGRQGAELAIGQVGQHGAAGRGQRGGQPKPRLERDVERSRAPHAGQHDDLGPVEDPERAGGVRQVAEQGREPLHGQFLELYAGDVQAAELPHPQPHPVLAGGVVLLQEAAPDQRGQDPVHDALVEVQRGGDLEHAEVISLLQEDLQHPQGAVHGRILRADPSPGCQFDASAVPSHGKLTSRRGVPTILPADSPPQLAAGAGRVASCQALMTSSDEATWPKNMSIIASVC